MSDLVALAGTPSTLPLTRVSRLLDVGRSTLYRSQQIRPMRAANLDLRGQIQRLAVQMSTYGYRRITAALQREGVAVNHKLVLRLMRADNPLCLRTRPFVRTTDSRHKWPLNPNLAPT